jgi:hypothetical protein
MLERILSGGQTGADRAGWRAAKRFGLDTGGWMPDGFRAEDGLHPEFQSLYGALHIYGDTRYVTRTRRNVYYSRAVLWIGNVGTRGYYVTRGAAHKFARPFLCAFQGREPKAVADWLRFGAWPVLLVAGNRESGNPGIGEWAESYLCQVFLALGLREVATNAG